MSINLAPIETATNTQDLQRLHLKLEVVTAPVTDAERAKRFYERLGWRLDADVAKGESIRILQFTPPGSSCSVHVATGVSAAAPGSAQGLFLAVSDIEAARSDLLRRGIAVSEVFHRAPGEAPTHGPHPSRSSYASFAAFSDPDGNGWLLQEVTSRLPGRVDTDGVTFISRAELATALRQTAAAHGEHEKRQGGEYDINWPEWYADHVFTNQAGPPQQRNEK